ncbi:unnamed protein product [Aphanomyces euteiches]
MDVEEDPSSRFVDYTNETDWERFMAALEDSLLQWGLSDEGTIPESILHDKFQVYNFHHAHYLLRLCREDIRPHLEPQKRHAHFTPTLTSIADNRLDLKSPPESIHRYFGCDAYLVLYRYHLLAYNDTEDTITVESAAGVREEDVNILLSSLVVALGNCNCTLPAFVAVGDLNDRRYIGAAVPGLHSSISTRFDTSTSSEVPLSQHCVSGLLDLFRLKLGSAADTFDAFEVSVVYHYDWHVPPATAETPPSEWRQIVDVNHIHHPIWKFMEWGPVKSPLLSLSLQTGWTGLKEGMYVDNAVHSTLNPMEAPMFLLTSLLDVTEAQPPLAALLDHLISNLHNARTVGREVLVYELANASTSSPKKSPTRYEQRVPAARAAAVIGQAIGSWVTSSKAQVPSIIASLMAAEPLQGDEWCSAPTGLQHAVVVGQLASRLAVHFMHAEELQVQCLMWVEFVRALRDQWISQQLLPHMGIGRDGMLAPRNVDALDGISMPTPDFHFNLLHQKLQMLNMCIVRNVLLPLNRRQTYIEVDDDDEFFDSVEDVPAIGVLKPLEGQYLLHHPTQVLNVPITQDPVPLTEDVAKEQQEILSKLGVSAESTLLRQQIQSTSMLSDMQAFKAANPNSCLADFIRWYSPRDWNDHELPSEPIDMKTNFPQGHLSSRMSKHQDANPWQLMWQQAQAIPAEKQKPLFDAGNEAEKIFHFLETISPATLLYHMVVATISNISVFWQQMDDWLTEFPAFVTARDDFQAKCNKAIAALDDAAVEDIKPTEEHKVLKSLADDACDKLVQALEHLETTTATLAAIRHVLPNVSPLLINDMVVTKGPVVVSRSDREVVSKLVWAEKDPNGPLHRFPIEREYVLRHTAPRPFVGTSCEKDPVAVSRFYANFATQEVRYALVLTDTEF